MDLKNWQKKFPYGKCSKGKPGWGFSISTRPDHFGIILRSFKVISQSIWSVLIGSTHRIKKEILGLKGNFSLSLKIEHWSTIEDWQWQIHGSLKILLQENVKNALFVMIFKAFCWQEEINFTLVIDCMLLKGNVCQWGLLTLIVRGVLNPWTFTKNSS